MKKKAFVVLLAFLILTAVQSVQAAPLIDIEVGKPEEPAQFVDSINILILLTILTLVPSILVLVTSFTRIVVVLSFLRNALSTPQTPPNQVLIGLALFLTFFIMAPVYGQITREAVNPYLEGTITQKEALETASGPLKEFMLRQTREKDLALFVKLSQDELPEDRMDVALTTVIPAFIISELKTAFIIGFLLYIPFIVIDLIVSSILMSMGMFMLPPATISLPFKLLLFILVDGWHLIVKSLVEGFV
ncbi:MAG TPA: flagellar type III secretion system pore protein FliP [Candidatus Atribacteria bacterium]|nr:flagellar type III secretion system pore protein FliP [Candidatus Atribacteria bacterium]HPT78034.1 flagellar type III secretion system pore protein FliP [Candidatus Atribacteria bacterium]